MDVDDPQAGAAVGEVGEPAHHLDVVRPLGHGDRTEFHRHCRVRDVDDAQAGGAAGHVGEPVHHLDVVCLAWGVEGTYCDEGRRPKRKQIDDPDQDGECPHAGQACTTVAQ